MVHAEGGSFGCGRLRGPVLVLALGLALASILGWLRSHPSCGDGCSRCEAGAGGRHAAGGRRAPEKLSSFRPLQSFASEKLPACRYSARGCELSS
jgi:hypothetical protein